MNNFHGEFVLDTLLYITKLAAENRHDAIAQMGLRSDQMHAIRSLTTEALHTLARDMHANFIQVQIDSQSLDQALTALHRRQSDEDLDRRLIAAGARYHTMKELSGLTTLEYAQHRRSAGVVDSFHGRPPQPSEQEEHAVWRAWQESNQTNEKLRYLDVTERTGISVGTIWRIVSGWRKDFNQHKNKNN